MFTVSLLAQMSSTPLGVRVLFTLAQALSSFSLKCLDMTQTDVLYNQRAINNRFTSHFTQNALQGGF